MFNWTPEQKAEKDAAKAAITPLNQEAANTLAKTLASLPENHFAKRDYGKTTFRQVLEAPTKDGGIWKFEYCAKYEAPKARRVTKPKQTAVLEDEIQGI